MHKLGGSTPGRLAIGGMVVATPLVLALAGCGGAPTPASGRTHTASAARQAAGSTLLATLSGAVPRFASPGGTAAGRVPGTWYGARSVLPVVATRPGWVRVQLAQRPNGSTAWLPARDVRLSSTPYRIVVNLATTRLALYRAGRKVFVTAVGVGAKSDPTPMGQYFVAFLEEPPTSAPGYGAFIMVTSAHSDTISDWEGSGDAVIGIHGPLGSGQVIGTTGARISHGCIRLHEAALLRLREVPPGTPIDIVG